jgi:tetratricopeptide (TPR) repeat protein
LPKALKALQHAEELASENDSPYLAEICQELAFTYGEMKMPENAMYYLDKTLDLECDHVNIEIIRGHILLQNHRSKEAQKAFKKAMQLSDNWERTTLRVIVSLFENHFISSSYMLLKKFLGDVSEDWNEGYSYLALCCVVMKKDDEFMKYLKIAVDKNPKEARSVLGRLFPEGMDPQDYYEYMLNNLNN